MTDRTGQNAIQALSVSGIRETSPAAGVSGAVKFHPGHYVHISLSVARWDATYQAKAFAILDSIGGDDEVKGVQIMLYPWYLEGTQGDYSAGFKIVQAILDKCASLTFPKRLILCVYDRTFGTATGSTPGNVYPAYWITNGYIKVAPAGSAWSGSLTSIPLLDTATVMDRLIAMSQAYGAKFDSHPLFEMWSPMGETTTGSAGLSVSGLITQYGRLMAATRVAWPTTLQRFMANFLGTYDQMAALLATARSIGGIAVGGPDPEAMNDGSAVPTPLPSNYPTNVKTITTALVFRGLNKVDANTAVAKYTDLRTLMPWCSEIQGSCGTILPAGYIAYERTTMHAWHIVHLYNDYLPSGVGAGDPHRWTAQRAAIHAVAGATNTGTPSEGNWTTA